MAIGTSFPEFVVDLTASHTRQYELAIGDIVGSSLVDASLSLGIEQSLFSTKITSELATIMGLCALLGSFLVILALSLAERVDRKVGAFFIAYMCFSTGRHM